MKKKMNFKIVSILLCAAMLLCLAPATFVQAASNNGWKTAYLGILKNWKKVEYYDDMTYAKRYFGSSYKFDRYFIYDLDKDGTPELFLYSSTMYLTEVFTYKNNRLIGLGCQNIYGINKAKKEIITRGHWHGSGGSGDKEWCGYVIKNNKLFSKFYIDNLNGKCTYERNGDGNYRSISKNKYKKIYKKNVKGTTRFSKFKKYKLSNLKGLNV